MSKQHIDIDVHERKWTMMDQKKAKKEIVSSFLIKRRRFY